MNSCFEDLTMRDADSAAGGKGFTLIEVLVALALLGIAFTAVLQANLRVQDSILASRRQTAASMLASGLLARVEAQGVEQWSRYSGRQERAGTGFSWRIRTRGTSARNLSLVRVEVRQEGEESILARREAVLSRQVRD